MIAICDSAYHDPLQVTKKDNSIDQRFVFAALDLVSLSPKQRNTKQPALRTIEGQSNPKETCYTSVTVILPTTLNFKSHLLPAGSLHVLSSAAYIYENDKGKS